MSANENIPAEEILNPQKGTIMPAHGMKRLINFLVDVVVLVVFTALFRILLTKLGIQDLDKNPKLFFLVTFVTFAYYIGFELAFQRTIGKMVTRTKTVNHFGQKPNFKQVLLRAFLRKLPIEFASYGGKYPLGWHDRMSNTLVVDNPIRYSNTRKPEENLVKMPHWLFILLCLSGIIIFVLKALNIIDGNIPL